MKKYKNRIVILVERFSTKMNILKKWIFSPSNIKIGFQDMKYAICHKEYLILNTLDSTNQVCLIFRTIPSCDEEGIINKILEDSLEGSTAIVLYGRNSVDISVEKKAEQLRGLGFGDISIYSGGIFEWLLLQDIYGSSEFPTIGKCRDLLVFQSSPILGIQKKMLTY